LHLGLLEDPSEELTIDDVSSPEFDLQFTPSQDTVPNFSLADSAYWVRLRLDNQTRQIEEWLLEVGFANMQYVDLYTPCRIARDLQSSRPCPDRENWPTGG